MFVDFFYYMRGRGLPVSVTEWMTLMEALSGGLERASLMGFYGLCRCVCVKREAHFDLYDQCFIEFFGDLEASGDVLERALAWLDDPIPPREVSAEELARFEALDLDELRRRFEERLAEQTERHDGGSHWIGTGGTSPFGHGGTHPGGLRVGGQGGGGMAAQVAAKRRFANLRRDRTLDVRQIGVALRQLRQLARDGRPDELDLDGSIDATARNAGDLELIFQPERKNTTRLLLLMDVGGSMTPFTRLSEQLFSAAHQATHFKAFRHYYFHNCPYETLYTDMAREEGTPTAEVLDALDRRWFCVIVGDAAMHPFELTEAGGAIDYHHHNRDAGLVWLGRIAERFPRVVWLNPSPERYWATYSTRLIEQVFRMFPLTVEGLERAVRALRETVI